MRAALYARVSTQEQAEHNYSLESQLDKLRTYCELHGHAVAGEYVDGGYSGTTDQRPELARLFRDAQSGAVEVVVVYKLDRFFRSQRHLQNALHLLDSHGVGLASATESFDTTTPMGRAMIGMLGTFAQLERDTFIERSKDGTRAAVGAGKYTGGIVAYGYTANPDTKELEIEPTEADIVRRMYQWACEGLTTHTISRRLNELGIPTKYQRDGRGIRGKATAGTWRPSRVLNMLKNPAYMGAWEYGKRNTKLERSGGGRPAGSVLTPGRCPAIVTREAWEQARARIAANAKFSPRNAKRSYLLSGLIKCACGKSYVGGFYKLRDGVTEVRQYRCTSRAATANAGPPCDNPAIPADFIEPLVWEDVRGFLEKPENVVEALERMRDAADGPDVGAELERIDRRLSQLAEDEGRLLDLYMTGSVSRDALDRRAGRIELERRGLANQRAEAERDRESGEARRQHLEGVRAQLAALAANLEDPTYEQRRDAIRALVRRVTVGRDADGEPSVTASYLFGEQEPTQPFPVGDGTGTDSSPRSARSRRGMKACRRLGIS